VSLNLYIDDCASDVLLVRLLKAAGHRVVVPVEVGLKEHPDAEHFAYAAAQGLVLLTKNPRDFLALHRTNPNHAGLLFIYSRDRARHRQPRSGGRRVRGAVSHSQPLALLTTAFPALLAPPRRCHPPGPSPRPAAALRW
jgi:hypothetical protein